MALDIVECLTEANYARVADTGQNTYFVYGVEPGLICELREVLDLFQGVALIVLPTSHEVDHSVLAITDLL